VNIIVVVSVKTLYRGIFAPVLVEAPQRAVKFSANEVYTKLYLKLFNKTTVDQPLSIATGMSTGATEAFVIVSFDLVKIRMQDKNNAGKYKNTLDCVAKIFREEGMGAFFKGLWVTILRHTAWNGGYFGVIHGVRSTLPKASSSQGEMMNNLAAGTIGGSVGTILNTPFDVVKTRIQNQMYTLNGQAMQVKYTGVFSAFRLIIKEEGVGALYKGFVPKVLRLGPGGGVLLVVFEGVSTVIRKYFL
jgi:solute carrier family 25 2-oxodicarboxylate transporter 21